jgi:uncharacterized protein YbjT (DUF2867 family)
MKVLVAGGTGFVGTSVVHALRAQNTEVRVLARAPERAGRAAAWGAEVVRGDVTDRAALEAAAAGCTHVVHLVAIIKGAEADFERVMVEGTRNIVAAAERAGVERLVLMSALGTSEATRHTVPYYRAKWEMERIAQSATLEHVILRPSFVFAREGGALPTFVRQVRLSPVVTVLGPGVQRSQPIWIDDLAAYVTASLAEPAAANRTFELGGPDVVTWNELYGAIARTLGKHRRLVHVPFALARAVARATQGLPGAPLTADQVTMLAGPDNVASNDDATQVFALPLVPLAEQLRRAVT